jgi:hypothetical protein
MIRKIIARMPKYSNTPPKIIKNKIFLTLKKIGKGDKWIEIIFIDLIVKQIDCNICSDCIDLLCFAFPVATREHV